MTQHVEIDFSIYPHFTLKEARCHDGTAVPKFLYGNLARLFAALEVVRAVWNKPLLGKSWYRTEDWNAHVGGAKHSRHLTAEACDIIVAEVAPSVVADTLERLIAERRITDGGIGRYRTFTHYDVRGTRARWGHN